MDSIQDYWSKPTSSTEDKAVQLLNQAASLLKSKVVTHTVVNDKGITQSKRFVIQYETFIDN